MAATSSVNFTSSRRIARIGRARPAALLATKRPDTYSPQPGQALPQHRRAEGPIDGLAFGELGRVPLAAPPHVQHALPLPQGFEDQSLAGPKIAADGQPLVPVQNLHLRGGEDGPASPADGCNPAARTASGAGAAAASLSPTPCSLSPVSPSPLLSPPSPCKATTAAASARGAPASNMVTRRTNNSWSSAEPVSTSGNRERTSMRWSGSRKATCRKNWGLKDCC